MIGKTLLLFLIVKGVKNNSRQNVRAAMSYTYYILPLEYISL